MRALGLMSGTSLDAIDVALIDTDGEGVQGFGPFASYPYAEADRALLRAALMDARGLQDRAARTPLLAQAEGRLTQCHVEAVQAFFRAHGLSPREIDIIGFHGQTVLHRPDRALTVQIGDGRALARALKVPVVSDFRAADMANGGQGAPFVPAYHRALVRGLDDALPVAVVNIGGVSNITYIDAGDVLLACDTGPGNALIDDFMLARTGIAMDRGGAAALRGHINEAFVARAMQHPFFAQGLPKSLDRNDFAPFASPELSVEDGAATLAAFTARAIAAVIPHLPSAPKRWIVCGGGAHNPAIMNMLALQVAPARVMRAEDAGWNADAIEAQAFAFLAVRSRLGLPLSYPGTTGVERPISGGVFSEPVDA